MRLAVHIFIPKSIESRLNSIVVTPISRATNVTKKQDAESLRSGLQKSLMKMRYFAEPVGMNCRSRSIWIATRHVPSAKLRLTLDAIYIGIYIFKHKKHIIMECAFMFVLYILRCGRPDFSPSGIDVFNESLADRVSRDGKDDAKETADVAGSKDDCNNGEWMDIQ